MILSRFYIKTSRLLYSKCVELSTKCAASNNSNNSDGQPRNPTPVFFSPEVQRLLKILTSVNMKKVYSQKREQKRLTAPTYQFMTSEEVEKAISEAKQRAEERLQMPPVLLPRSPIDCVLAKDPVLQGYCSSKFVFTDISYGKSDRERYIVVRDPDGTLRKASWEERDRMNLIYFPLEGRHYKTPQMFESEHLEALLAQRKYEFVLDRACLQFEPDDPIYVSVTHKVYEHIDENRMFDSLRSTRHFGPLAFYLAWNCKIDNLVLECLQIDRLDDAARTVQLLDIIHPFLKSSSTVTADINLADLIKIYAETSSKKRGSIELALQGCMERRSEREKLSEKLEQAHGQY